MSAFMGIFGPKLLIKQLKMPFYPIFSLQNLLPHPFYGLRCSAQKTYLYFRKNFASNLSATHVSPCSWNVSYTVHTNANYVSFSLILDKISTAIKYLHMEQCLGREGKIRMLEKKISQRMKNQKNLMMVHISANFVILSPKCIKVSLGISKESIMGYDTNVMNVSTYQNKKAALISTSKLSMKEGLSYAICVISSLDTNMY